MLENTIYLKDYAPTPFLIHSTDLIFRLEEGETRVFSTLKMSRRNGAAENANLKLHGEQLALLGISLNGAPLTSEQYQLDDQYLTLDALPEHFTLEIETRIHPETNTALSGLYKSSGNFCTQCEAEGFRRITYYYDRPDVLSVFSTRIEADPSRYPVLLSNGNLTDKGTLENGRHWVLWQDPFPKPAYLFALVAGNLAHIHDTFITMNHRAVDLYIYTEHHNIDQCEHAMESLKASMRWDEDVYGREYDLDCYMIVAVDDFNMGAMENKGLNIFNSKYILAKPETATDDDYQGIESVVAHEYFHNWSGNRVTCRDWFQLSLKEGFTVFRDQEFSADMQSRGVKRIEDIDILRSHQFREDSSPMAHPVRPESYVEINNFYTLTVYEKGATLIRMLHLMLGKAGFRKGCDLYFARFDGQAVTTEDFIQAMEEANEKDFSQFKLWYQQAGTPELRVSHQYDSAQQQLTLNIKQHVPDTLGQSNKRPMLIPFTVALLDQHGNEISLKLAGEESAPQKTLLLSQAEEQFTFLDVPEQVTPSLLRDFSAPVKLEHDLSEAQQYFLMAHDQDDFVRWDAGQQLATKQIQHLVAAIQQQQSLSLDQRLIDAFASQLKYTEQTDLAMLAQALTLPSELYLSSFFNPIDPVAIYQARQYVRQQIATQLHSKLLATYLQLHDKGPYQKDPHSMAKRKLKNICLSYLMEHANQASIELCEEQFYAANNMTDALAALSALINYSDTLGDSALESFYDKWSQESLVVDKWLSLQASNKRHGTLNRVKALTQHPAFKLTNPNKVRALISTFAANAPHFHEENGNGYQFLTEHIIKLNSINPQIAARLVTPLISWRKYNAQRQEKMQACLQQLAAVQDLSRDVYEVVGKALE